MVRGDLNPDFIETTAVNIGWEYHQLFETLAADPSLTDDVREEEFNRRRGFCAVKALSAAALKHGVPYEFRRLCCNGQKKLLVKAGRVIILQESILSLADRPKPADYKLELSQVHATVRQLELPLGDRPQRITDWSGCFLGALLHGATGPRFTEKHKMLGGLSLGFPDAAYGQWVLRLDLHDIAMFGRGKSSVRGDDAGGNKAGSEQRDEVVVTSKRDRARGTA